jgi:putative addiction module component (TIGR02574 family)
MFLDKDEIMKLHPDEKRRLAFELLDSIDEEFIQQPVPEWKKQLIRERIESDKRTPGDTLPWSELRKKYLQE